MPSQRIVVLSLRIHGFWLKFVTGSVDDSWLLNKDFMLETRNIGRVSLRSHSNQFVRIKCSYTSLAIVVPDVA